MKKSRVIFNEDMTQFLYEKNLAGSDGTDITEDDIRSYVAKFKDTSITDFFMNVSGLLSVVPSKIKTSYSQRALVTEERGEKVDYMSGYPGVQYNLEKRGLDLYKIWTDELKKIGITPWLSFRMNDVHCLYMETPHSLVPPEYYENYDKHSRVRHREQMQYYDRALDFGLEWVRTFTRDYIDEMLDRYDVYGVEFDFQRELECFGIGREEIGRDIMTDFIGELKDVVSKYENKYGHKIQVALRGHQKPEYSYQMGFDIGEIAKRGYIDMYIASPRYSSSDMDMPLVLWKQLLSPYNVEVLGAMEINIACRTVYDIRTNTFETCCALASSILSQGCGVYLFNHFPPISPGSYDGPAVYGQSDVFKHENIMRFLCIAGDFDAILSENRKCIATPVDKAPLWSTFEHNSQIPLAVDDAKMPGFLRINTGKLIGGKVILNLGIAEEINPEKDVRVFINSVPAKYIGSKKCGHPHLTESDIYEFEIDKSAVSPTVQMAEIIVSDGVKITVDYADIEIIIR